MRDRWDEDEEELGRGRSRRRESLHEPELEPEPTLGELIEGSVRKLVTGMVIAGGLIGLGVYGSSRGESGQEYQITTSADGRTVYRVNTDSGSIVACRDNHCWLMQRGSHHLDEEPPAENVSAATPAPVQAQPAAPQVAPQQQPTARLPAPQNSAAPAAR